jgi:hypothetical protein
MALLATPECDLARHDLGACREDGTYAGHSLLTNQPVDSPQVTAL